MYALIADVIEDVPGLAKVFKSKLKDLAMSTRHCDMLTDVVTQINKKSIKFISSDTRRWTEGWADAITALATLNHSSLTEYGMEKLRIRIVDGYFNVNAPQTDIGDVAVGETPTKAPGTADDRASPDSSKSSPAPASGSGSASSSPLSAPDVKDSSQASQGLHTARSLHQQLGSSLPFLHSSLAYVLHAFMVPGSAPFPLESLGF